MNLIIKSIRFLTSLLFYNGSMKRAPSITLLLTEPREEAMSFRHTYNSRGNICPSDILMH